MSEKATLNIEGSSYELPIVVGTEDEKGFDISRLRADTGYITLDNGFKNTGSTQSAITFLDGEKGVLRYRGYPISHLKIIYDSFVNEIGEQSTVDLYVYNNDLTLFKRMLDNLKK